MIVACVGVVGECYLLTTKLIEDEDGTFPEESQLLVLSKHRTCVSFILISGLWTKKVVKEYFKHEHSHPEGEAITRPVITGARPFLRKGQTLWICIFSRRLMGEAVW